MKTILYAIFISIFLASCGGGGSSSFIGAANVRIETSPNSIDTGDRTKTEITISDVNSNGIILKIFFPSGLSYVSDSSFLKVDDNNIDISPTFNESGTGGNYLVYFLSQEIFNNDGSGKLSVEFEASSKFNDRKIEVDADVNDPLIEDGSEFDSDNPEFASESSASIEVTG